MHLFTCYDLYLRCIIYESLYACTIQIIKGALNKHINLQRKRKKKVVTSSWKRSPYSFEVVLNKRSYFILYLAVVDIANLYVETIYYYKCIFWVFLQNEVLCSLIFIYTFPRDFMSRHIMKKFGIMILNILNVQNISNIHLHYKLNMQTYVEYDLL